MNKEQITLAVVLLMLGGCYFLGRDPNQPSSRRRGGRSNDSVVSPENCKGNFLGKDDYAWSLLARRNMHQAPRETTNLKELDLLPPPAPRLPHPGLPLIPNVGGGAAAALRHDLVPDPKIVLPAAGGSRTSEAAASGDGEGSAASELDQVDTSSVGLSLGERLRLSTEEKARRKKQEDEAKRAESERRRMLDQIIWPGGQSAYGIVAVLEKKEDRFAIKDLIDRVRSDGSLGDDERKRKLDPVKFVFREDRGPGKQPSRTVVTASSVQRIEFAPGNPTNRYFMARLSTPLDDIEKQEDLAKIVFDAGDLQTASAHLAGMMERGLASPKSVAMLADSHRRLFRYDQELQVIERGLAKWPNDIGLLARLGQLCLKLRLPAKAEESFARAVAADPANALTRLGLGQVHLERGSPDDALVHLRQAETGVGLDREQQTRALVLLGEVYLAKGILQTAGNYFGQALDRDPQHARALAGNVVVALAGAGPVAAKGVVDRAREQNPVDGTLAYLDGVVKLRLGEYGPGRDALLLAMDLDPLLTSHARTAMSYLMEKVGKDEAALAEADAALVADPLNLEARQQRARSLLNVGDVEAASDEYLRVLEGAPEKVDILVALGDAAFRKNSYVEASRYYARADSKDPKFPDLLGRRLICELRKNRVGDAEDLAKRIDAPMQTNPYLQAAQALLYYKKGKYDETLRLMRLIGEKKAGSLELVDYSVKTLGSVEDNQSKERWEDVFNRSGGQLLRGWKREVGSGINVAVRDGRAQFGGTQRNVSDEATVLYQERPGRQFFSFSVDLDAKAATGTFAGAGIMSFNPSPKEPDPWAGQQKREGRNFAHLGLQVALAPEGRLQWRKIVQGKPTEWADLPSGIAPSGPFTVTIELQDSQKGLYRVLVDQQVALKDVDIPGLARRAGVIELQVFCQAAIDRAVSFAADNVTVITYKK